MKKWLVSVLCLGAAGAALAQDIGRVISSTPIVHQVAVPRRVCTTEQIIYQQPNSGAGAVLGAIAGAAIGNAVGGRAAERAAATAIGMVGGAVIGDRVEGAGPEGVQNVERCTVQNIMENRGSGYQVVYEFGGKQYSVQLAQDPGPSIALQVSPASGLLAQAPAPAPAPTTTTVISSSHPVYTQPSVTYINVPPPSVYYPVVRYHPHYRPLVVVPWGHGRRDRHLWR
jgi:uncharacterized protein YcfJ